MNHPQIHTYHTSFIQMSVYGINSIPIYFFPSVLWLLCAWFCVLTVLLQLSLSREREQHSLKSVGWKVSSLHSLILNLPMTNSTVCVSDGLTEENMTTVSLGCVFTGNLRRNKETFISLTGSNNVFVSLSNSSTPYGWVCFSHAPEDEGTQSNHCSTLLSLKLYICVINDVTKGKSNCFCVTLTQRYSRRSTSV